MRRFGWATLFAALALSWAENGHAQEKTPFPSLSDKRVYVSGVPDKYPGLATQINQLERSSPQTYYVVVVKGTGPGKDATVSYAEDLFKHWRTQAAASSRHFDADRSVIFVLAVDNKQVAVHPGALLRTRFGLGATKIERDLIEKVFIDGYALKDKYPEGLAALVNATNDAIAERDDETARAPYKFTASGSPKTQSKSTTTPAKSAAGPIQTRTSREADAQILPVQAVRSSTDWKTGLAVVLPIIAAAIGLIVAALWWGYRRTRSRVGAQIGQVRTKAVDVMDRLDALKERLKLLPTSPEFTEPLAGETEALYRTAKDKNDKLRDGWLQIMEVLDKAQKLADRSGSLFSQKTLAEAEKLIEQKGSFQQIEKEAKEIAQAADRLDKAPAAARAVRDAIAAGGPKLTAAIEAIAKLGLPVAPYQSDLDKLTDATTQAAARMVADPLGTQAVLEEQKARSGALLSGFERVSALFEDARQMKVTLETIRKQVAAHRAQGLKLVESGGNPDGALEQGQSAQAEILAALREGNPDAAAEKLSAAQGFVQEAQSTIEQVQKARTSCDRDPAARSRETERLRTAIAQAESYQADLERDFAPSSWTSVARNLDQARALLATFDRQVQDAVAIASSPNQEYLKASRMLDECARQQQIVLRLMSGLGEQLNNLIAVRNESRSLIDQLASGERQAESLIRQNELIVSDATRASLAKAQQIRQEILLRSGKSRPDWPALRQSLAEALEDISIARSQAEDDVKNYQQLTAEFETTRQTANRVYALLSSHQEDRPAANQHYQAASEALDRIAILIQEPRGASAAWLAQVRDAAADLERSEQLAREDIRLAAQAQSEISDGASAIRQAQSYGGMGIFSDISNAQSQLMQAEQLLQSQNYEQSIQYAGSATQMARQVYYAAMQQAMAAQMAAEAEQRRQAARLAAPPIDAISFGAAAATTAAARILENAGTPPAEPEAATAGGSWDRETAGGSW